MKEGIHPDYHEITIVRTNGESYTTRSCWGKPGETMNLDVDPLNHPAWQGGAARVIEKAQLSKFEKRFGTFLSGDSAAAPPAGAPRASKDADAPAVEKDVEDKKDAKAAKTKKK